MCNTSLLQDSKIFDQNFKEADADLIFTKVKNSSRKLDFEAFKVNPDIDRVRVDNSQAHSICYARCRSRSTCAPRRKESTPEHWSTAFTRPLWTDPGLSACGCVAHFGCTDIELTAVASPALSQSRTGSTTTRGPTPECTRLADPP